VSFSTWEERRRESRVSNLKKIHVNEGMWEESVVFNLGREDRLIGYRLPKLTESILMVTDSYWSIRLKNLYR
jgi:hypothetical protein